MDIILAILLYLNVIQPGCTITTSQIDADQKQYQEQFQVIQSDPNKQNQVMNQESPFISTIIVIDDTAIR